MADTRIQLEVEDWVRRNWLAARYGEAFSRERMKLVTGGVFDFDAVSQDGGTVACISTSGSRRDCLKFRVRAITSGPKEAPHGTTQTPQHSGCAA